MTSEPYQAEAASPMPAGPGQPGLTGHPAVDAALAGLTQSATLPPAEQVSAYEAAHRVLQQTLTTIDQT